MTDLTRLKKLCKAATPGPWTYIPDNDIDDWMLINSEHTCIKQDDSGVPISKNDGEYIAAASPETVTALIARVEKLEKAAKLHIRKGHNDTCSYALSSDYDCDCGLDLAELASDDWKREGQCKGCGDYHDDTAGCPNEILEREGE